MAQANMTAFMRLVHSRHNVGVGDYASLYRWSVDNLGDFWSTLWDYAGIVGRPRRACARRR
jgi:acetoacetyl-CoA synthetase